MKKKIPITVVLVVVFIVFAWIELAVGVFNTPWGGS